MSLYPDIVWFAPVRYALEALYVGEVVEYQQLFSIQVRRSQLTSRHRVVAICDAHL